MQPSPPESRNILRLGNPPTETSSGGKFPVPRNGQAAHPQGLTGSELVERLPGALSYERRDGWILPPWNLVVQSGSDHKGYKPRSLRKNTRFGRGLLSYWTLSIDPKF